jgi:hypothetical protein
MQPARFAASAIALTAAVTLGTAAMAADLPRQGTFEGTYSSFGTFKPTSVGKELLLAPWEENGLSVGSGFIDHMTWHCFGLYQAEKGQDQAHGYCVATDADGDQVVSDVVQGKGPVSAKVYDVSLKFTSGTGKYAGISGAVETAAHAHEIRPATENTYHQYATWKGSYKLP